ncbi:substrate-binding domain-containing protein [Nocardioides sp. GCM10027113]|uniref:substrate-binding domain-containing protein n=1 Tax=unclassified Nocardioides TaxID=2615069 RepID=UPI003607B4A4
MARFTRTAVSLAAVAVLGAGVLSACGANEAQESAEEGKKIALLLPESKTTRYEAFDRPLFEERVAELCSDCEITYFNADQDPAKQQQQVETAISDNVDVMVLDPVDGKAAAGLVTSAQDEGIPVVAYDRFIEGSDYYLSFNNAAVGELQGEALLDAMGGSGKILMLNGAPTDPNAAQFKEGAHAALDGKADILAEYDNPDWSPDNAQQWTTDQLGKIDPKSLDGIYAANDGQAGGVVAAMTGAGVPADQLPPITGQDAELAAIQRIVAGEQAMTIYKPIKVEAYGAAELAVKLVNGEDVTDTTDFEGVASYIYDPIVVTVDNIADTVVADEFYSIEDICSGDYAKACADAGLS